MQSNDSCQNKASADLYHMTILQAQKWNSSKSCFFLSSTINKLLQANNWPCSKRAGDWVRVFNIDYLKNGARHLKEHPKIS